MRFLGIDKDNWIVIVIIIVFLILLAAVSWLSPELNLWDNWWTSLWWIASE